MLQFQLYNFRNSFEPNQDADETNNTWPELVNTIIQSVWDERQKICKETVYGKNTREQCLIQ